jgi:hypothetical protein
MVATYRHIALACWKEREERSATHGDPLRGVGVGFVLGVLEFWPSWFEDFGNEAVLLQSIAPRFCLTPLLLFTSDCTTIRTPEQASKVDIFSTGRSLFAVIL